MGKYFHLLVDPFYSITFQFSLPARILQTLLMGRFRHQANSFRIHFLIFLDLFRSPLRGTDRHN